MRNAVLVVFGLVIGAVLAEGILRLALYLPDPRGSAYVRDPDCAYRLRPEPVASAADSASDHINGFGFRDREHPIDKPAGTLRILGLGDSFVYGAVPLDRNFLRVASDRLSVAWSKAAEAHDAPGSRGARFRRAESVLMGLGGYCTANELGVLESTGLGLHPDVVVLCFFVGNDVTGIPVRGEVLFGRLYYVGSATRWRDVLRHARAYVLAETFFVTRIKRPLLARSSPGGRGPDPGSRPVGGLHASSASPPTASPTSRTAAADRARSRAGPEPPLDRSYVDIESRNVPVYARRPTPAVSRCWEEAERQIIAFDAVCRRHGVPWMLFVIPEELQVDPRVRAALVEALALDANAYDFEGPQRRLARLAARHGIHLVDPLPRLRAAHDPQARLYHPNDTHWNAAGNAVAAEVLVSAIQGMMQRGAR